MPCFSTEAPVALSHASEVLVDSDSEVRRTNEGEAAAIALQQRLFGPASKFLVHGVLGSGKAISPPLWFGHSHNPKVSKFEFTFLGPEKSLPSSRKWEEFFFSDLSDLLL